jgi:hypothetical protein
VADRLAIRSRALGSWLRRAPALPGSSGYWPDPRRESTGRVALQAPSFAARPSNEPHRTSAHQRLYGSPVGVRSGRGVIAGAR